jgi:GrpB-like predicted nucleotidyltransferase (UPF0157 family)
MLASHRGFESGVSRISPTETSGVEEMIDAAADRVEVELRMHDPAWEWTAMQEARRLAEALGRNLIAIHHIGSTAVPGIKAKPTIDLMPIVRSLSVLDARSDAVRALGYECRGEFGLPGRRYYTRSTPDTGRRLFNVHAYEHKSAEIDRHLAFCDYLRQHPQEARAYEAEKERAATLHPNDTLAYNDAKASWLKPCELRALAWWSPPGRPPLWNSTSS